MAVRTSVGPREALITEAIEAELLSLGSPELVVRQKLEPEEAADRIALHISRAVDAAIRAESPGERVKIGIEIAQRVIDLLIQRERAQKLGIRDQRPKTTELPILVQVKQRRPDGTAADVSTPLTPLLDTTLLTNARGEPALGLQLQHEIASSVGIDAIMAFVRYTGIRPLLPFIERHCANGRRFRLLTTTYTQSTEARALDALAALGVEIRVSYELGSTRLHAKSWLFQRDHGLSTAFVGSSNLTHSAQFTGLEWNVRLAEARNAPVIEKIKGLFESYWQNRDFEPYDRQVFNERMATAKKFPEAVFLPPTEIRLEPFQARLLEQIALSRRQGRHRNLLVSATGTGKTVIAAIDYTRLRSVLPRARLLFVAHRKEILEQARQTFRHALRSGSFGELWVDQYRPIEFEHVFASIQSLDATGYANLDQGHYDVVVIDEFHHAAAKSYERLLNHLRPRELLGLTATPERSDGLDILRFFDGGRIAAELRLWDAIEEQRLSPFLYFGIHDDLDLRHVPFKRGRGYDTEALTHLLTANDIVARRVYAEVDRHVADIRRVRALGFCVSVAHADFMARKFNEFGLNAVSLSGGTLQEDRERALSALAAGTVQFVFSVDLLNEGVDIPLVDTLLLLRPTESATLFIQQLGRGLRRHRDKTACTVLDFVGHHRAEFRFDLKYRALLQVSQRGLKEAVEQQFPYLPSGCYFSLDSKSADIVLSSLKTAVPSTWRPLVRELRLLAQTSGDCDLRRFLTETGASLEAIYGRTRGGWSELRQEAGLSCEPSGPMEGKLRRGIGRLLHLDDEDRIRFASRIADDLSIDLQRMSMRERRQLRMILAVLLDDLAVEGMPLADGLELLRRHPQVVAELREVLPLLTPNVAHIGTYKAADPEVPLCLHARYRRREILAACGVGDESSAYIRPWREGVLNAESIGADVFVVTVNKSDRFSPTTRYKDYAINSKLFHWESQSQTTSKSETGLRYQEHESRNRSIMLFVRETENDAFYYVGKMRYLRHESEKPMRVTWELHDELPGDLYLAFSAQA